MSDAGYPLNRCFLRASDGTLVVPSGATLHVESGGTANFDVGSTVNLDATLVIEAGSITPTELGTVTDDVTLDQNGSGSTLEIKSGGVGTSQIAAAAVTSAKMSAGATRHTTQYTIAAPGEGDSLSALPVFCAPQDGCVLTKIGIVAQGTSSGISNSDTCVVTVACTAGTVVAQTYNSTTTPPTSGDYASLGTLANTTLTANEVVTLAIAQGTTANIAAFLLVVEWVTNT